VTATGVPKPADAIEAARACGLALPERRVTRATQIPGLVDAWYLALDLGMLELADGEAAAGETYDAWPDGADEDVLDVWLAVFALVSGLVGPEEEDEEPEDPEDGWIIAEILELLAQSSRSEKELSDAVQAAALREFGAEIAYLGAPIGTDPAAQTVALLEQWDVAVRRGQQICLTPLGEYACRALDLDPGEQADPSLDAVRLLDVLLAAPERGWKAAQAWIQARTPRTAASGLLTAAETASPTGRIMAISLVHWLGAEALDAWKKAVTLANVGPHARAALWEAGAGPEPSGADSARQAADLEAATEVWGADAEEPGAAQAVAAGYQLKITLRDVRPPVWRRVVVPDITLSALHEVVQCAIGWENDHMHVFEARGTRYGRPDRSLGHRDEAKIRLSAVFKRPGDTVRYEYDFGDGWEHDIMLEKLVPPVDRATCTAGRRHGPPEDCGGPWGYYDLCDALTNPKHERREELTEWLEDMFEGGFDPEHFDVAETDRALARVLDLHQRP
jgi:hypothetical protein